MYICVVFIILLGYASSQTCPVEIPEDERRDCYPWSGATPEVCAERGCVWCQGQPQCFYNHKVCPSEIPETSRVDCMPGGGTREDCLSLNCLYCETTTPAIPWCFADPDSSLGGAYCPSDISTNERIDCHSEPDATESMCIQRGCYWCNDTWDGTPPCFTPRQTGYKMMGSVIVTPLGYRVNLERMSTPSWHGHDIQQLVLDVEYHTDSRLRLKFYDPSDDRFEVPLMIPTPETPPTSTLYDVIFDNDPVFSVKVLRVSTGTVIFDTSIGGFQFADQFLQIATRLNSSNVYGIGEQIHDNFERNMEWENYPMYSRDQPVRYENGYGVHPVYMNVEESSDSHMVLFLNSNAQEITLQPAPALTYRTIGGVLDVYLFLGPQPEQAVKQYHNAVGLPLMPPYWTLGFHLCRWGYNNLTEMQEAVNRMRYYDIPHDVQYGDIDYMDEKRDFTIDPVNFGELPEYVDELMAEGTRFIIILDPGIHSRDPPGTYPTFDNGEFYDVWIQNETSSEPFEGRVWPGPCYYPDFLLNRTQEWWTQECIAFKEQINWAALWIDMNEPSNFDSPRTECEDTKWNYPPFLPEIAGESMTELTTCMGVVTDQGISYNTHSLYGWSMAHKSINAARASHPGLRSMVISRSTFPGAGQWAQHWLGDNYSRWSNLRHSIIGMIEFNLFGMPFVGADICGFLGLTTEELCRRWQQLGAFYTFSRNHNSQGIQNQDPGMWPTVAADTRKTLHIRYSLLPYLYTLFHHTHMEGGTVIRSLMFEFTSDQETYTLSDQFMWGPAFLISPVLDENTTYVDAYFPDTRWFDYYTGEEISERGEYVLLDAPIDHINLHVRGGFILPTQLPSNSTLFSRENTMGLIVALDDEGMASGDIFWDDGESLDTQESGVYYAATFTVISGTLTNTITNDGYPDVGFLSLDDFTILGPSVISSVTINGATHTDWQQDPDTQRVNITNAGIQVNSPFTVTWI